MIIQSVSLIQKIIYTAILMIFIFITPLVVIFKHSPTNIKLYLEYIYSFLFLISLILSFNKSINAIQEYTFFKNIINFFSKPFWIFALVFYTVYLLENIFISKNTVATIIDILCILLSITLVFNIPFITKLISEPKYSINIQWFILCILCFIDIMINFIHSLINR